MKNRHILTLLYPVVFLFACGGGDSSPPAEERNNTENPEETTLQSFVDGTNKNPQFSLVYVDDEAVQCEPGGLTIEETAQVLLDNDIQVIRSGCGGLTGIAVPAVCGAGTTGIHLHMINSRNVPLAASLGYHSVESLANENDSGFLLVSCPLRAP